MDEIIKIDNAGLKPGLLKLANQVGRPVNLSFDQILKSARNAAGSQDLGAEWWDEPLRTLIAAINEEARLSFIGSLIMRQRLKGALVTRIRAEQLFRKYPEILDEEVAPIRLITGLQRTGTTFLQRLLSIPSDARALLSWESLDPVPRKGRYEEASRIRSARLSERALAWMSPGFFAIHPIDHLRPEEDVLLLDHAFMTTAPEAIMHVPTYAEWLENQDHTYAYEWEKKMLQLLQWQRPAEHWVLKSPHHLEHLTVIRKVFPEIKIVWMHRPPQDCVASFLSMVYHGRAMFSNSVDAAEVSRHWLRKNAFMVDRAMEGLDSISDIVTHAYFDELVEHPMKLVSKLYGAFGASDTLDSHQRGLVQAEIDAHSRHRFGKHQYALSDYGLTEAKVKSAFQNYIAAFLTDE